MGFWSISWQNQCFPPWKEECFCILSECLVSLGIVFLNFTLLCFPLPTASLRALVYSRGAILSEGVGSGGYDSRQP